MFCLFDSPSGRFDWICENVDLLVELDKKKKYEEHQSHWDSSSGDHDCVHKKDFIVTHLVVVEIFQEPELAWLKKREVQTRHSLWTGLPRPRRIKTKLREVNIVLHMSTS